MSKGLNTVIQMNSELLTLPPGDIISFDAELIKNLIIIWINVMILVAILAFILYKPIIKFMNNRSQTIKNKLDHAKTTLDGAPLYN